MGSNRPKPGTEDFEASLPRSMNGDRLRIVSARANGVMITDGRRAARYVPHKGKPLTGELRIVPGYTEAGYFAEANCVRLSDGTRTILYVPERIAKQS